MHSVVIIGGGVSGTSTAYHLVKSGVLDVCLVEAGEIGYGVSRDNQAVHPHAETSGSAVFTQHTDRIKMMVNLFPSKSKEFISNHGIEGAKKYLQLARKGIEIQKALSRIVFQEKEYVKYLLSRGSVYVCFKQDVNEFEEEFEILKSLGCNNIELWDERKMKSLENEIGKGFVRGIYFPDDAIINSAQYAKCLIRHILNDSKNSKFKVKENCRMKTIYQDDKDFVKILLENGEIIKSQYVVMATGGLHSDPNLTGILSPCWSYLVSIDQTKRVINDNTFNIFTWGFTHDFSFCDGRLRCSGEDHFSALKPPSDDDRCQSLVEWSCKRYPYLNHTSYIKLYGVYSETPDKCPIVGLPNSKSRVCYILGCNAWGQASLSYSASLIPGLLGFTKLTEEDQDLFKLISITRFTLLKCVL